MQGWRANCSEEVFLAAVPVFRRSFNQFWVRHEYSIRL